MGEWIELDKRRPEHKQKCLVYAKGIITAAEADLTFYEDSRIYWDAVGFGGYEWEYDFSGEDVSHWMPLPKGPV